VKDLVLGQELTYVSFELVLKELEGNYGGGGEGDVGSGHTLPEEAEIFV